jgi:hypothetical protein
MKRITCSLIQVEKAFNEHAEKIAECHFDNCGLLYRTITVSWKTIEIAFYDFCEDRYIIGALVALFTGLGGVDIDGDIFDGPSTIF